MMNRASQYEVILHIQELIDKYRCGVDGFFTDSKTAATEILKYLQNEGIMAQNQDFHEMKYNEQNKAA